MNIIYLVLSLFEINPTNISASPISTSGNPVHNKTRLLLSPNNINPIPKHCNAIPIIVKLCFFIFKISSFVVNLCCGFSVMSALCNEWQQIYIVNINYISIICAPR